MQRLDRMNDHQNLLSRLLYQYVDSSAMTRDKGNWQISKGNMNLNGSWVSFEKRVLGPSELAREKQD